MGSWTGSGRPSPSSSASSCSACATAPLSPSSRSSLFPPPSSQYLHYTQAVSIVIHAIPTCPILSQCLSHVIICHLPHSHTLYSHHPLPVPLFYTVPTLSMLSLICLDTPASCHPPYPCTVSNMICTLFLLPVPTLFTPGPHQIPTLSLQCPLL
jgi:hypothetical protein